MGGRHGWGGADGVGGRVAGIATGASRDGVVMEADAVCRGQIDGGLQGQVRRLGCHELEQEACLLAHSLGVCCHSGPIMATSDERCRDRSARSYEFL